MAMEVEVICLRVRILSHFTFVGLRGGLLCINMNI